MRKEPDTCGLSGFNSNCCCKCCKCRKCGKCCKCCICVIYKERCEKEICEKECCEKECCEKQCECDVIESIALQEAALAHILNAEGEKIQKAVKTAKNVCELLAVNSSVIETINSITRLELTLISKLNAIQNDSSNIKLC